MTKLIRHNWLSLVAGAILGVLAIYWIGWFEAEFYRVNINIHLERAEGE